MTLASKLVKNAKYAFAFLGLFTVLLLGSPAIAQITGSLSVCQGSTTTLNDVNTGGVWSSSNTAVATVGSTGIVTGMTGGTAVISYTVGTGTPDVATVNVTAFTGTIYGSSTVCIGNTVTLTTNGASGGFWSSSNSIATVSSSGVVTGNGKGANVISYTVSNSCGTGSATFPISVGLYIGDIYTYAGSGTGGNAANGVTAFNSPIQAPRDLVADTAGNVFFVDATGNVIKKITTSGLIYTVAGTAGVAGSAGDGYPATSSSVSLSLSGGGGVVVDNAGNIYISSSAASNIRKVNTSGIISTVAGSLTGVSGATACGACGDNSAATAAILFNNLGLAVDTLGNLYFADQGNNRIRKISTTGIISNFAGSPTSVGGYSGDNGQATNALLYQPRDVKIDINGNFYIADALNNVIRKVSPAGIITTIAGTGTSGFSGDGGQATAAHLNTPARLAYDGASMLYFSDQTDQRIRQINLITGIISTVAGNGTNAFAGDGGPATAASMEAPAGIGTDNFGDFFIAESGTDHKIRVVASPGSLAIQITSTGGTHVCSGTPITFKAYSSITGGEVYHWQKNRVDVSVGTSRKFTTTSYSNNDTFRCIVFVTPPCSSPFTDTSNVMVMNVDYTAKTITSSIGANFTCAIAQTIALHDTAAGGTWTSSNPLVALVGSSSGLLTGVLAGTSNITYSVTNLCGTSNTVSECTVTALPAVMAWADAGGTISPSGIWISTLILGGATNTYTITPSAGYNILTVWVDSSTNEGSTSSYTFSGITSNHTIHATFVKVDTILASAGANGSISPSGTTTVNEGSNQAFTMTPATGYHVSNVVVDGSSAGAVSSYTFSSVTGNHTISVSFAVNTYTITATAGANGTISPSGATTVNYGGSQTYTITPATGYGIANVTVDGSNVGTSSTYTFSTVSANHTISVSFYNYNITATAGANGSISPSGVTSVAPGGSQSYTITPATGYSIANVTVDGSSVGTGSTYSFSSVTANHTISASFIINTYNIVASSGSNGTVTPGGTTTVNYGANQTYSIIPATGYSISNVTVDGSSVGNAGTYTFSAVSANHTISASFAVSTYTITASADTGGTISPSGSSVENYGNNLTYTITPATNHIIHGLIRYFINI